MGGAESAAHKNEAAIAGLMSLLTQIKLYKHAAWSAREMTKALYAKMEKLPEEVADEAVKKATATVEQHIREAHELDAAQQMFLTAGVPPVPGPPDETIGRATAQYDEARARAMGIAGQYQYVAEHEAQRAKQLHENAKTTMKQAMDFQTVKNMPMATQYQAEAERMFLEAQKLHQKAADAEATA